MNLKLTAVLFKNGHSNMTIMGNQTEWYFHQTESRREDKWTYQYEYDKKNNWIKQIQFCFINQITYAGSDSHSIITKMIVILNHFLENTDEDGSNDLEFDKSFQRLLSRATFQTF